MHNGKITIFTVCCALYHKKIVKVATFVQSACCQLEAWGGGISSAPVPIWPLSAGTYLTSLSSVGFCKIHPPALLQTSISCRMAVVMMQYSIMANSYWLLVEGIYLHNLLVITVFTERNYFKIYLYIGWGEMAFCCVRVRGSIEINAILLFLCLNNVENEK